MTYLFTLLMLPAIVVSIVVTWLTGSVLVGLAVGVASFFHLADAQYGPILINDDRRTPGKRENLIRWSAPLAGLVVGLITRSLGIAMVVWAILFLVPAFTAPSKSAPR